jgi:hypothetical protein
MTLCIVPTAFNDSHLDWRGDDMRDIWNGETDPGQQLWRYVSADRFAWIIQQGTIYFAAATQFDDPFEGAVAVLPPEFPTDPRYREPDHAERAFRELKRLTKISCWHRADYESDAMWKLYSAQGKGVAIRSTPERIAAALRPFRLDPAYEAEDLWGGPVRYVDLLQTRLRTGMLERFFYKHRAFEWEREFRFSISLRTAEEFGVPVPERGIEVSVDLSTFVQHVLIGPMLEQTDSEKIIQQTRGAGLGDRIAKSSLLGTPRYT